MDSQKTLVIQAAPWSAELSDILARGVHDDLVTVATVRAMVEAGRGQVYQVLDYSVSEPFPIVGAFVLSANHCENGSELVLQCASGDIPGSGEFTKAVMPWVEQQATALNFKRVRVGVARKGMTKLLEGMGYQSITETFIKVI